MLKRPFEPEFNRLDILGAALAFHMKYRRHSFAVFRMGGRLGRLDYRPGISGGSWDSLGENARQIYLNFWCRYCPGGPFPEEYANWIRENYSPGFAAGLPLPAPREDLARALSLCYMVIRLMQDKDTDPDVLWCARDRIQNAIECGETWLVRWFGELTHHEDMDYWTGVHDRIRRAMGTTQPQQNQTT